MTPKEKAEELLNKMYGETAVRSMISEIEQDRQYAKKCALIAVDEIMKMGWNLPHYGNQEGYNYWYLVKQEIEAL